MVFPIQSGSMVLLQFLQQFVSIFFDLLSFAIIARVVLSWLQSSGAGRLKMVIYDITEPVLGAFRRIIPRVGMIDISPIVALLFLDLSKMILLYLISYIAKSL